MTQSNPYESPQVTELSERVAVSDPAPDSRDMKFLEQTLGPEWKAVKKGAELCTIAIGVAIAGSIFSFIIMMIWAMTRLVGNGLDRPFSLGALLSVLLGCILHIVGLRHLRKVNRNSRAYVFFTMALISFLLVTACAILYIFGFGNHFSIQLTTFVGSAAYIDCVWLIFAAHNFSLLLGLVDLRGILQERKSPSDLSIAIGLFLATSGIVFGSELMTALSMNHVDWLSTFALVAGSSFTMFFYVRGLQKITSTISKIEKNIPKNQ